MKKFSNTIGRLLFIGIIFLSTSGCVESARLSKRSVAIGEDIYKWTNGLIMYKISDNEFNSSRILSIFKAMRHWEASTCIKFVELDTTIPHPDYIKFQKGQSVVCGSDAGQFYNMENPIRLADSCTYQDIVRQLGHVIGLYYEHQRPDRNEYVRVNDANIQSSFQLDFDIKNNKNSRTFGFPYDFNSIMQVERNFRARDKLKDTLTPVKEVDGKLPVIGQAKRASPIDFQTVNLLYNCPKCGGTVYEARGEITSPKSSDSNGNIECEWRLIAPHGHRINLNIPSDNTRDCSAKYLEITEGYPHENPIDLDGCSISGNLEIQKNHMILKYRKSRESTHKGFTAEYKFTCNHTIFVDEKPVYLESPNWPEPYGADQKCFWRLKAPKNRRLTVKFNSVELETDEEHCSLKFDDGTMDLSACNLKKLADYVTTGNHLEVAFVPGSSGRGYGFSISITAKP